MSPNSISLRYYVYFRLNNFGKGVNFLISPAIDKIVSGLFFHQDGFGIKYAGKDNIPLNKETKYKKTPQSL